MTSERATIRDYRPGDGDGLRGLWHEAGFRLIGDDDDGLARFAERNPGGLLVAEDARGTVVGSTMAAWDGRRGWLYHVAVAPNHRRTGLGTALVTLARGSPPGARMRARARPRRGGQPAGDRVLGRPGYVRRETHQLARTL